MINNLNENGWCKLHFSQELILSFKTSIENHLKELVCKDITLESYHEFIKKDDEHIMLQSELTRYLRSNDIGKQILHSQLLEIEKGLEGKIKIQNLPYLRIARPNCRQDNIGYHKDTFYGGYPEELSCVVAFTELDVNSALAVLPKSHLMDDEEFPFDTIKSEDVTKGDIKHNLGFLYQSKVLKKTYDMKPVPLRIGEGLVFYLSTLHGQEINLSNKTRWTMDIRIVKSDLNLDFSARPYQYEEL